MEIKIKPAQKFAGELKAPGDKSISHRALIYASLTEDKVEIESLMQTRDIKATLECLSQLGVDFVESEDKVIIYGKGLRGFKEPKNVLDVGNSEIAASLLTGLLAGQPFFSTITGSPSLQTHHMKNITKPLQDMGATIKGRSENDLLPLSIRGYDLMPLKYDLPVSSAQVKSALLTAALFSRGKSELTDLFCTRDHTERMLRFLGADINKPGERHIVLNSPSKLKGEKLVIPGDISSSIYFILAAALAPEGELKLNAVGINPSRTGVLDTLKLMGANITIQNEKEYNNEPVADLLIKGGEKLKGVKLKEDAINSIIDDIPAVIVAALYADGDTVIKTGTDLRPKKGERLDIIINELRKKGASIKDAPDGLIINGNTKLSGEECNSSGDYRIAMALSVASLYAETETIIKEAEAVDNSVPGFYDMLKKLAT